MKLARPKSILPGGALLLTATLLMGAIPPPEETVPGTVRIAGNPEMRELVDRWCQGSALARPGTRYQIHLTGSDTGMAALYTGKADVVLLGRSPTASEIQAFEWIFHYKPAQVEIMTGSLSRPGRSPALVAFVHRNNPISQLTLAQLAGAFAAQPSAGQPPVRTWSDLGASGELAGHPVNLYTVDMTSGTGRFFRHAVLHDSRLLNWSRLTEFAEAAPAGPGAPDAERKILTALAQDAYGLALADAGSANAGVKPLALAATADAPASSATRANVAARAYPLARPIYALYNRDLQGRVSPDAAAFLRYILEPQGQSQIAPADDYLPLPAARASAQRALVGP